MKGGTDMIMDKTTMIVTKFSSDSEEDQTEVKNREILKSTVKTVENECIVVGCWVAPSNFDRTSSGLFCCCTASASALAACRVVISQMWHVA